jgi:hypothetical protein
LFVCNLFSDAFSETQNYVVSNECMMSEWIGKDCTVVIFSYTLML